MSMIENRRAQGFQAPEPRGYTLLQQASVVFEWIGVIVAIFAFSFFGAIVFAVLGHWAYFVYRWIVS